MSAQRFVRYLLYLVLVFTPLARAAVQEWAVCILHIMTLSALTVFLLDKAYRWEWKWIKTPLDMPITALLCICALSAFFSEHRHSSFRALVLLLDYLIWFYLLIHTVRTRSHLRQVMYVVMGAGTFLAVFGLFKQWGLNPFPWWEYSDIGQDARRLSATYGNPDHLAGYMELAVPLSLCFMMTGIKDGKLLFLVFIVLLMFTSLILTLSRGGWIGILCGLYFMGLILINQRQMRHRKFFVTLLTVLVPLTVIVLSGTDVAERMRTFEQGTEMPSFDARVSAWKGTVNMIKKYPLLGAGPGTYAFVFTQYQPPGLGAYYNMAHNDYLHFIAETGLIFAGIVIGMICIFYRAGFKKIKHPSRLVRGTALGGMSGITAMLVHSIGDFNLHIPANALLFTVLAGIVAGPLPKSHDIFQPAVLKN